jgi:2-polyprenyl-3-methyl-5-hydroxy-6-metoxy-1,4-benzoquinol methylase
MIPGGVAPVRLAHPDAVVELTPTEDGRHRIDVRPHHADFYVQGSPRLSAYSPELIELILEVKGPAYLCDEIARDEDPAYTRANLETGILSYLPPEDFGGCRILDFGCGSAASTMILARLLPGARITGVELFADSLRVARARAEFHELERVEFLQSPGGTRLPEGLGEFDHIVMNAVFEHLLPEERAPIMEALWRALRPGGVLFLQETPDRRFPLEMHTTGLPLLNYLPDRPAGWMARRLSKRVAADESWEDLLRAGIRGGTPSELRRLLRGTGAGEPEFLRPCRLGRKNAVDLWYAAALVRHGKSGKRRLARQLFELWRVATGTALLPEMSLAIRKGATTIR